MASSPESVPFNVNGKAAIVTGAGSGINLCFAQLLLSRGCNVVFADLALRPEAQATVDDNSSHSDSKPRAVFVKTDVTVWDQLSNVFDVAEKEFGGADIVVYASTTTGHSNRGTGKAKDALHGAPDGGVGHYATLDINITHPIRTTQLAISRWLNPSPTSRAGTVSPMNPKRVVHTSSIAGQMASLSVPLYVTSKHAISGFVRALGALDGTHGIRVNAVAPGVIRTPLWTDHPEKMKMVDGDQDVWVEPMEVAEQMLRCCEDEEIPGGVVWEVLKGKYRKVSPLLDPGPEGPGARASNHAVMRSEILGWLAEPGWGIPDNA